MLETTLSFKNLVQDIRRPEPQTLNPNLETGQVGSTNILPEPVVFFSPRPVSELNAAATTVQKIYKSYRTRRNLADCAVVVEELWLDVGDGKEVNVEKCPRSSLQRQCIKYLGPNERESYEVIVENGKLVFQQSGLPLETIEGSKWIFVLSTSRNLYVGQKKKGLFQHSSFLAGGATTAAGRLVAHDGVLEAIWPYSGHYLPTEENFREFICFLEDNHVDLTNVKRCSVDDDDVSVGFSFKASGTESKPKPLVIPHPRPLDILRTPTHASLNRLASRLSCKWTSGTGPRIGCVRDYPAELQFRALEQVNLSPRVVPTNYAAYGPVPSPRPSPKVRLSPRLSYMGLPSPRTPVATTS
ncbi:hypothetical protein M8C21_017370 [Ambrosia artemisiifolia]|uniref:Uncharacterized protein n=1 Tax=Ambrosia artemisiifolia TaxID=4212 RepID=A0AAD5GYW2_AMBAR|nr:hypothetical protein M8C21_017370 [Ambrosia artemisiifolia]